ncbi:Spy/CpxP family protein refolding chaperone [Geobacter sp. SVR]|uniref:Spy/CpxP family protein refolding chaperone n=1 Tax=Geobacter sp. SVR TaxID=2495594 RepID=UPI00143F0055|nr:Spy/CpxP family protein refolding chaperone [Geobacter sp. SVR]BCS52707.1 hypothetical protein GSVR_10150 [Geobacter sp. SVR]GCF86797.1 hypothetical protein GSbR_33970 [Geobacter sp. SVR]
MKTILAVLFALVLALPAFAQMHGSPGKEHAPGQGHMEQVGPMDGMGGDMMEMCLEHADDLGLNPEQVRKINAIHREMKKKQIRFKADWKLAEMDLKEILEVRDFDMKRAMAAVQKISDLKTSHRLDMLKSVKDLRLTLTDEQFQEMRKMMMAHGGCRGCGR